MKQLLLLLGCLWAVQVQAVPVVFSTSQFNTSTSASVGNVSDADSASSPPTALSLVTFSFAPGVALSTALADTGLLSVTSFLSSAGPAAGAGTSEFIGTFFAVPGSLDLVLNLSSVVNGGTGGNLLHLLLVSGSVTLLDELFSTTQTITRDVDIVTGALTTLQLTLSSQSSLPGPGTAARSANLEFDVDATPRIIPPTPTLPEPGTLLLLAIALTLMALSRRRSIAIRQAS